MNKFLVIIWMFTSIGAYSAGIFPNNVWMIVNALFVIACLLYYRNNKLPMSKTPHILCMLYITWMIICFIRGVLIVGDLTYYHQKALLTSTTSAFMFVIAPIAASRRFVDSFLLIVRKMTPLFIIYIIIFTEYRLWSTLITPIFFIYFFCGKQGVMYKVMLVLASVAICCIDFEARAPFAKFGLAIGCLLCLNLKFLQNKVLLRFLSIVGFALPIVLFFLAVTDVFNVLDFKEYTEEVSVNSRTSGDDVNLYADTRTFIYAEVLSSAVNNDYILEGRSFARGNDSYYALDLYDKVNLKERFMNESSLLNIFTWEGLIGIILYSSVFIYGCFNCIQRSKNKYLRVMALFLSFIWAFSWVEIINTADLCYATFLVLLGICMSREFLEMSDLDFENWAHQYIPFK